MFIRKIHNDNATSSSAAPEDTRAKDVKPRILCEKYLTDKSGNDIRDYKFSCFNGKPRAMFLCVDRNTGDGLKINYYDMEWNKLPVKRKWPNTDYDIEKPAEFEEMIELAKILSKGIPYARIDFYICGNQIYFSEITLYPISGHIVFIPEEYNYIFGSYLELPQAPKMV